MRNRSYPIIINYSASLALSFLCGQIIPKLCIDMQGINRGESIYGKLSQKLCMHLQRIPVCLIISNKVVFTGVNLVDVQRVYCLFPCV